MKMKSTLLCERPRERLVKLGPSSLSNVELVAIILSSGTKEKSVRELSEYLLNKVGPITTFKDIKFSSLIEISGIKTAKAASLLAAIELGKRVFLTDLDIPKEKYNTPKVIYEHSKYLFNDMKQELFVCFYLNNKNHLLGKELLFVGTVNKSLVHPREIFKNAYLYSASSIVCIHNHPSGDLTPSKEDLELTNTLIKIGELQKIPILDHLIVSNVGYYSIILKEYGN